MRKSTVLLLITTGLVTVGFLLLRLDGEHLYTGHDSLYGFLAGLGLFLLFIAFIFMLTVYGKWSFKLKPALGVTLGVATMVIASVLGRILVEIVSVHAWNFVLLALPAMIFLCGAVATVIAGVRLFRSK